MHQGIEALVLVLSTLFAHVHSYGQDFKVLETNQLTALLRLYKSNGGGNWSEELSKNWLNPGFGGGSPYNHPCNETDLFDYYYAELEGVLTDDELDTAYPDKGYWSGIDCRLNMSSKEFFIEGLKFQEVNVSGSVPTQIGYLTDLTTMNMRDNQLHSQLPTELGALSQFRTRMSFDANKISGTIPSQLGSLHRTWIKKLNFNHNVKITGTIPTELGDLTGFVAQFRLTWNQLSGTIPTQLGLMTEFTSDYRSDKNELTGSIPTQFGRFTKVKNKFRLDRNSLSGCIPTQMGNMFSDNGVTTKVYGLELWSNQLSCSIPTQIGQLTGFTSGLSFGYNSFTGSLPTELGLLTGLTSAFGYQAMSLYGSSITGNLPSELGQLSDIGSLDFRNNELCGTIPSEVFGLLPFNSSDVFVEDADGVTESFYDFGPSGTNIHETLQYITENNTLGYWCTFQPSRQPTIAPTGSPSVIPTPTPTALCIDRPNWNRAQEKDLNFAWTKNCSWVREWPNNRCDRIGVDGTYSYTACAKTCAGIHEASPCSPTAAPTVVGLCSNSDSWRKGVNKPNKDCRWVGRHPNNRCKILGTTGYASAECPMACGTCSCADDTSWRVINKPNRGCDWVAGFPKNRCRKVDSDGIDGFSACPVSCLSC